jgi:ribosomal-protein-alanine N-acetyltransferase
VHITVLDPGAVTVDGARTCCDGLARAGWTKAVTNALSAADAEPLLAAGFTVQESLRLLGRPLDDLPPPGARTRPARRLAAIADLDRRAFGTRGFDARAVRDAYDATPRARLRRIGPARGPVAYAVTGIAGRRAYVQRLAVDPRARRRGLGRVVLRDGLRWARRAGATTALVNTHEDNDAASALYRSEGFAVLPRRLVVLERSL